MNTKLKVRLEVVSIISYAYPSFSLGLTNIANHWFKIFIFIKSPTAVTSGRNSNATPAQSPVVSGNFCLNPQTVSEKIGFFTSKLKFNFYEIKNYSFYRFFIFMYFLFVFLYFDKT